MKLNELIHMKRSKSYIYFLLFGRGQVFLSELCITLIKLPLINITAEANITAKANRTAEANRIAESNRTAGTL